MAWCITNYETTDVLELFLHHIKTRSPEAAVSVLMSDDGKERILHSHSISFPILDNAFCTAAKSVYGEATRHILCRWHVDR